MYMGGLTTDVNPPITTFVVSSWVGIEITNPFIEPAAVVTIPRVGSGIKE
jgi:hypothetical protein